MKMVESLWQIFKQRERVRQPIYQFVAVPLLDVQFPNPFQLDRRNVPRVNLIGAQKFRENKCLYDKKQKTMNICHGHG